MSASQTTGIQGAQAANENDPTETVVVSISPPPPPPPPPTAGTRAISETTQHLLIAAGSIGMTDQRDVEDYLADQHRRNNHSRDDLYGYLYHAKTGPHIKGSSQAWKEPSHSTWTTTATKDLPRRHGLEDRLQLPKNEFYCSPTRIDGSSRLLLFTKASDGSTTQR